MLRLIIKKIVKGYGLRERGATNVELQQCPPREQLVSWVEEF